jgi:translation initiation factor IF-3
MPIKEALSVAADRELDLVEVSPSTVPPVCER